MTNRERAEIALMPGTPDRVPIFELLIDPGVMQGILPGGGYIDFVQCFDLDIVLTGTPSENYRMEPVDLPKRVFRDEWGVLRRFSGQTVSFPMGGPIRDEADLDGYTPPDPRDPYRFTGLIKLLEAFKGTRLVGMHVHDAFSYPSYLLGMDELLAAVIERPELVRKLVRMGVEHTRELMAKARSLGAELFVFGDDYAGTGGPFMSPRHFQELFLPGLREVVEAAKDMGALAVKHSDGNLEPILEMIVDIGIDGLHPLDPEAGMDIGLVKERYGNRICVIGNIDTGRLLAESTPRVVEEAVRRAIMETAPGGGYIISSANSIHSRVKPENYRAMLEAAVRYGDYRHLGRG
ncbi:MAG: uroporphyrinogen decarboxylase family protein [Spirochaetota bacterium]